MQEQAQLTTITLSRGTRDALKELGRKGETYEDIIKWMMGKIEYEGFMDRQYDRLSEKEKYVSLDEL